MLELNIAQIVPKVSQRVATKFLLKIVFFQYSPKRHQIFGHTGNLKKYLAEGSCFCNYHF